MADLPRRSYADLDDEERRAVQVLAGAVIEADLPVLLAGGLPQEPSNEEVIFPMARAIHDELCDCPSGDPECPVGDAPLNAAYAAYDALRAAAMRDTYDVAMKEAAESGPTCDNWRDSCHGDPDIDECVCLVERQRDARVKLRAEWEVVISALSVTEGGIG